MPGLFGSDFDPTVPADTEDVSQGAARIRDIKTRIKSFFEIFYNLDTAAWNDDSITSNALEDVVGLGPGTYTFPTVQVDSKGRIVAIASGTIGSFKAIGAVELPATGGTGQTSVPSSGNLLVGAAGGIFILKDPTQAPGGASGVVVTIGSGTVAWAIDPAFFPVVPFFYSATLPSVTAATPVTLVPDFSTSAFIGTRKAYLTDFIARVDGSTAWGTTTSVSVQDTNGTPVNFAIMAASSLTANAVLQWSSGGVTLGDAITRATGGTAGKGLQIVGNVNGTGSNLIVSGWGFYK